MKEKIALKKDAIKTCLPVFSLIFVIVLFAVLSGGTTLQINNIKQIGIQSCTYIVAGWEFCLRCLLEIWTCLWMESYV